MSLCVGFWSLQPSVKITITECQVCWVSTVGQRFKGHGVNR